MDVFSPTFIRRVMAASLRTAFFLFLSTTTNAQSNASIQGEVTDPNGAVVPEAEITLRSEATGIERKAISDSGGRYLIAALAVGDYHLEVQASGFTRQIFETIHVEVGRVITQNFQLQVGDVSQTVTVPTNPELLEQSTMAVGHVVDQQMVQETPLNGRYFLDLGLRVPGSVTPPQGAF
jgi:hypothetical protein